MRGFPWRRRHSRNISFGASAASRIRLPLPAVTARLDRAQRNGPRCSRKTPAALRLAPCVKRGLRRSSPKLTHGAGFLRALRAHTTAHGAVPRVHKTYSVVKELSIGGAPLAASFCSHSGEAYRPNPTVSRGQTSGRPGSPSEERSDSLAIKYTRFFWTYGIENAMLLKKSEIEGGISVCSRQRGASGRGLWT